MSNNATELFFVDHSTMDNGKFLYHTGIVPHTSMHLISIGVVIMGNSR